MSHLLTIGCTGMLEEASLQLAEQFEVVSVVGRNQDKLKSIKQKKRNVETICFDYFESGFIENLEKQAQEYGSFSCVVAWIRSKRAHLHSSIRTLCKGNYHMVLGSSHYRPGSEDGELELDCNRVILGFKVENGKSRWLTDREISQGVIESVISGVDIQVGQIEPWSLRP